MPKTDGQVRLHLDGPDGNAFVIMGVTARELKRSGNSDLALEYRKKARSGDYKHLLAVTVEYVNFVNLDDPEISCAVEAATEDVLAQRDEVEDIRKKINESGDSEVI